ncbi:MAG TPA: hypothetical protein V6D43_11305 [Candidatus Sericytochromatia bacterium]|jgi:hypothetical protein
MQLMLSLMAISAFCVVAAIIEAMLASLPSSAPRLKHNKRDRLE